MQQIDNAGSAGKGYLALLTTSLLWGTTWIASKMGVVEIPALQMASIRQGIAGLCFVVFFMGYKKFRLPSTKQFQWILVMAILMFVFANGLSTWGLKYIPAGLSALIGALYPLSVVIIEKILYRNRQLTAITFIGLFLGIMGVGIVFYEHAFHGLNRGFLIGLALSIIAMLSWSVGTVFLSRNKAAIDPYYGTGWQMLISSIILFGLAKTTQTTVPLNEISLKVWLLILYLVIFGSLIAFAAFIYSMKRLPAAIASLYAYINPLVAMVLASFLLEEKLTINILWGALVTLAGVFLVNYSVRKENEKAITEAGI